MPLMTKAFGSCSIFRASSFARRGNENLSPERVYDPSCNLILEREQVGAVAVEALGPHLDRPSPIDELCAYAHVLAISLHAAFESKLHSEVATQACDIHLRPGCNCGGIDH